MVGLLTASWTNQSNPENHSKYKIWGYRPYLSKCSNIYIYIYILVRTCAFPMHRVCSTLCWVQQASVTLPCSTSTGRLDLSVSVRFRLALCGRPPQRSRAGGSGQANSSAPKVRVATSGSPAEPKWVRAPSELGRPIRAPSYAERARSWKHKQPCDNFEQSARPVEAPRQARTNKSSVLLAPKLAPAAISSAPARPSEFQGPISSAPAKTERTRAASFKRPSEAGPKSET